MFRMKPCRIKKCYWSKSPTDDCENTDQAATSTHRQGYAESVYVGPLIHKDKSMVGTFVFCILGEGFPVIACKSLIVVSIVKPWKCVARDYINLPCTTSNYISILFCIIFSRHLSTFSPGSPCLDQIKLDASIEPLVICILSWKLYKMHAIWMQCELL